MVYPVRKYLASRGLNIALNLAPSKEAVERSMELEVENGRFMLKDPEDGRLETKRCTQLVSAGVLTSTNAPELVQPAFPPFNHPDWHFAQAKDLECIHAQLEMISWHDRFFSTYAETSAHLRKALMKLTSGRAYDCRCCQVADIRFFRFRIEASMRKNTHIVMLAFRVPVGRQAGAVGKIVGARCTDSSCTAGEFFSCCSHVTTGLAGLTMLQSGLITAGDIGDGSRAWGRGGNFDLEVQSVDRVALLTGGAMQLGFDGFRPDAPPLQRSMPAFIARFQELAGKGDKPIIAEIHAQVRLRRGGPSKASREAKSAARR